MSEQPKKTPAKWRRKKKGQAAAEIAKLPPDQWPAWYKPARGSGGDRPAEPYQSGNAENLRGGWRSPRVYNRVAAALAQGLLQSRPDLAAFPEAVAAWSDAEARVALLRHHLDNKGMFDEVGDPRESPLKWLNMFEQRAAKAREQLGLDPRAEAELALLRAKALKAGALTSQRQGDLDELAKRGQLALEDRLTWESAGESGDPLLEDALAAVRQEAQNTSLRPVEGDSGGEYGDGAESPSDSATETIRGMSATEGAPERDDGDDKR